MYGVLARTGRLPSTAHSTAPSWQHLNKLKAGRRSDGRCSTWPQVPVLASGGRLARWRALHAATACWAAAKGLSAWPGPRTATAQRHAGRYHGTLPPASPHQAESPIRPHSGLTAKGRAVLLGSDPCPLYPTLPSYLRAQGGNLAPEEKKGRAGQDRARYMYRRAVVRGTLVRNGDCVQHCPGTAPLVYCTRNVVPCRPPALESTGPSTVTNWPALQFPTPSLCLPPTLDLPEPGRCRYRCC